MLQRSSTQLRSGERLEGTIDGTDRRTGSRNDDSFVNLKLCESDIGIMSGIQTIVRMRMVDKGRDGNRDRRANNMALYADRYHFAASESGESKSVQIVRQTIRATSPAAKDDLSGQTRMVNGR